MVRGTTNGGIVCSAMGKAVAVAGGDLACERSGTWGGRLWIEVDHDDGRNDKVTRPTLIAQARSSALGDGTWFIWNNAI